jgi:hypothetical protein
VGVRGGVEAGGGREPKEGERGGGVSNVAGVRGGVAVGVR